MRILVDLTHPAHVHFYRHAIDSWRQRGHRVLVTARRKDIAVDLLRSLRIPHDDLGPARIGLVGLGLELLLRTARLCRRVRTFRPDVMTAVSGVFIAQAGWLCRVPSIVFYDTEIARVSNLLTHPFCSLVSTPQCYEGAVPSGKHRSYDGYQELAYTHPKRFAPDVRRLASFGLSPDEPFIFVRLVSWGAAHDVREHGFTCVEEAVRRLETFGRVIISSERALPERLEPLRLSGPLELVHHVLHYARIFVGESATMASESAMLGTPAVLVSTSVRGYTNEQEAKYGLTFTFSDPETAQHEAIAKAVEILADPGSRTQWMEKRERMLAQKIDVTEYVVQLVESFGGAGD